MQEAAALGYFFHAVGVRHILASPLERAWRTALIAGEAACAPVQLDLDIAEWWVDESENSVQERVLCALQLACQLSTEHGPVALVSHGAPILAMIKHLGLGAAEVARHRIYDSRNLLPAAGAWEARPALLRLAFVPDGVRWPADVPASIWL